MYAVWSFCKGREDSLIGHHDSERSARRQARQSTGHVVIFETDDATIWGTWDSPIVAEFADYPGCNHLGENEDEVAYLGGKCPVCMLDWLVPASRMET